MKDIIILYGCLHEQHNFAVITWHGAPLLLFVCDAGVAIEAKLQQDIVLTILDSASSADAVMKEDMWSR